MEHFESIKLRDSQIKEDNLSKNIPYELGDVDCLFYDLDKNIRIDLLQKLYEDYQEFAQQQAKDNGSNFGMEEEIPQHNQDFFDPADIDLMQLGNLPLRRDPF